MCSGFPSTSHEKPGRGHLAHHLNCQPKTWGALKPIFLCRFPNVNQANLKQPSEVGKYHLMLILQAGEEGSEVIDPRPHNEPERS